jgi:hypothetical protein
VSASVPAPADAIALLLAGAGLVAIVIALVFERRMQRRRQPGVSYRDVTLRADGGWRRSDLFTSEGLALQRRAAAFGWLGATLWLCALAAWVAFRLGK